MKIDSITYEIKNSWANSGAIEYEGDLIIDGKEYHYGMTVYVHIKPEYIRCARAHLKFDHVTNRPRPSRSDVYSDHTTTYSRIPKKKWYDFWSETPKLSMPDKNEVEQCIQHFIKSNMENTPYLAEHIQKVYDESFRTEIFKEMVETTKGD